MRLADLKSIYFIGIGGIGMSALARYFRQQGKQISGYDRTATTLTLQLEKEGIPIHYTEDPVHIPQNTDLVVITPAIPSSNLELAYARKSKLNIVKRSELLGLISEDTSCIAVAGTHGKTTTSTLIAHILRHSSIPCNAFLGGISKNYQTNLLLTDNSNYLVTEADEYDRSFLQLNPTMAVITSLDPDHLDIYLNKDHHRLAYTLFMMQIKKGGVLLLRQGLDVDKRAFPGIKIFTYGLEDNSDYQAINIHLKDNHFHFDLKTPDKVIKGMGWEILGRVNVENAIAASAIALLAGVGTDQLIAAVHSFRGVVRRMDVQLDLPGFTYIDDYAHHPAEINACIEAVRAHYPDRKLLGVFQPHLFTRTRDFADEFARSLEKLDELILLKIYPAREKPIPGITSKYLLEKVRGIPKSICSRQSLLNKLLSQKPQVLLTLGAGDISLFAGPIKQAFSQAAMLNHNNKGKERNEDVA